MRTKYFHCQKCDVIVRHILEGDQYICQNCSHKSPCSHYIKTEDEANRLDDFERDEDVIDKIGNLKELRPEEIDEVLQALKTDLLTPLVDGEYYIIKGKTLISLLNTIARSEGYI